MTPHTIDEEAIFKVACRIADTDARAAYLEQVCGDDESLKRRVEDLLRVYLQDPDYLEVSHASRAPEFELSKVADRIGSSIGPYTLRELIGEGGMGEVYVAEQAKGVRRKVALKIIKPGMATKDVVARFEAERQALAMMNHPHIARVLDGGTTDSAQPYFVMELVQGLPMTEYCDVRRLDTRERLTLFTKVCRAVHHAHQKGIIHRDLKPSNVLVPEIDGAPFPKVIDFGIAKAVNQKLTEQTLYTNFSQMVGTPLYMSPEQAGLGIVDIDTRSDIYSLGVLLYELITGSTPFDREKLKSAGFDEMRRMIREDEPPRPSAKLDTLNAQAQSTVSERRSCDSRTLSTMLKGELDWIVMKAMDKDRNRRYDSANALAEDVDRYLRDDPVAARPMSGWYRFQKFARRNRVLVASMAAVFVALSVGATLATVAFFEARQARLEAEESLKNSKEAEENSAKLAEIISDFYPRPWGTMALGKSQSVYDSMEAISQRLNTDLKDYPEVEIKVRKIFAEAYTSAREFAKAREHLRIALERADKVYTEPTEIVADIHALFADEIGWNGDELLDFHQLLGHANEAIRIYDTLGIQTGKYCSALFAKGQCLYSISPIEKAEAIEAQRKCVEVAERMGMRAVIARWDLGLLLINLGEDRLAEARRQFEIAIRKSRNANYESSAEQAMETATAVSGVANCLLLQGNIDEAIEHYEESWRLFQEDRDLRHEPRGHRVGYKLVETYFAHGELQRAFTLLEEMHQRVNGSKIHLASLIDCLFLKGWLYYQLEDYETSERFCRQAMDLSEEHYGDRDAKFGWPCGYVAMSLEARGQQGAAARQYRRLLTMTQDYTRQMSPRYPHEMAHWLHIRGLLATADVANDGKLLEAQRVAEQSIAFAREKNWRCLETAFHCLTAELQLRLAGPDRGVAIKSAIECLRTGLATAPEPQATHRSWQWNVPTTRRDLEMFLVDLFLEDGNATAAKAVHDDAVIIRRDALGSEHIQTAMAQLRQAEFLVAHAKPSGGSASEAEQPLLAAFENLRSQPDIVHRLRWRVAYCLAEMYQSMDQPQDAAQWRDIAESYGQPEAIESED